MCLKFKKLIKTKWLPILKFLNKRFIGIKILNWNLIYFKNNRAKNIAFITVIILISLNFHVLFTYGQISSFNGTQIVECYSTPNNLESKIMDIWPIVKMIISLNSIFCFKILILLLRFIQRCILTFRFVYSLYQTPVYVLI